MAQSPCHERISPTRDNFGVPQNQENTGPGHPRATSVSRHAAKKTSGFFSRVFSTWEALRHHVPPLAPEMIPTCPCPLHWGIRGASAGRVRRRPAFPLNRARCSVSIDQSLLHDLLWAIGIAWSLVNLLGIGFAVHAVMHSRTAQGSIAWAVSLVAIPHIAIPFYLIFGRRKFHGYVKARRAGDSSIRHIAESLRPFEAKFKAGLAQANGFLPLEKLSKMPFTHGNGLDLLVDGEATFKAIFDGIAKAEDYVLIQFFIIHDDELGRALKALLLKTAERGVRILLLYDEIGSHKLPAQYIQELRDADIEVKPFNTRGGKSNRFQINFRNHRKIVIVDGRTAFVGGLNVGDEYMGRSKRFGPWRDTHLRIQGPAVQCVQLSFVEDWYWAARSIPPLEWQPVPAPPRENGTLPDQRTLVLPTSPADSLETCTLTFLHLIATAKKRLWITSPYFVPDQIMISALQMAALRGVDVRILLPEKPDHLLVWLSSFSFIEQTETSGVKFYRYQPGFLHQKVILVDDLAAGVGTANMDNRSFRLNFEITIFAADHDFAEAVTKMLRADFARSRRVTADGLRSRSFLFKLAVTSSRLMAPIQ